MTTSVLVLGAGFGGLEASARLSRQLGDRVDVTLVERGDAFVFGFSKLDVMFGRKAPEEVRLRYADYAHPGVHFRNETVTAIDPVARRVTTDRGTYEADILIVALGAGYDLDATPGLRELGREFYSVPGAERVGRLLPSFTGGDIVIGVCGPSFKCPPAPNECALLLDQYLRDRGIRDRSTIKVVVPMGVPLPPSPELSRAILDRYAERGIEFVANRRVTELEALPGQGGADGTTAHQALLDDGTRLPFNLFLGIPVHRAPMVVVDAGLTEDGWIPVDKGSAATRFPGVYAVGDVTSVGTPKAGVFAERAAHAMADQLVARINGEPEPPGYNGTGACYVELGNHEVGGVAVDFFAVPGSPKGWFTEPSAEVAAAKAAFGPGRRARWFGAGED